jgi:hypothetical protein
MRRTATTEHTPNRSRSSSIRNRPAIESCWSFSFRFTIRQQVTVRATTSERATARQFFIRARSRRIRRSTRLPTSKLQVSGRESCNRGDGRRSFLGSGAGASGLSRAYSERLHVSFPETQLGAAKARKGNRLGREVVIGSGELDRSRPGRPPAAVHLRQSCR